MDLLNEGVQDKGIFKAIFMAGGPGSGKTFVNSQLFGIPDKGLTNIGISGLKSVNSDREFMFLLKKYGFDPTMLATYEKNEPDLFHHLSAPAKAGGSGLRDFAQELKRQRAQGYMQGKLGMVIDSTGSNFARVQKRKKELEENGYDCYMVFVMTSLDTALQRNKDRAEKGERELPASIVKKSWNAARKNLGGLKSLFGKNFKRVDNDDFLKPRQARQKFVPLVKKYASKWVNEPIKNPIGKQWVKDQMKLQKAGVKK
tara:strand:- start:105 stop:875 length:771 start_codon:yes stop_codon:yes gene_type:complete